MPIMAPHILLVEDEKHLGVGIKYNLQAEGYRVTLVEDGATALRLVRGDASHYALLILDLMLPGMSGYTVCETLRDAGINTPVLMLSARTLAEDRTRGFDVGANQYLTKPFDLDELLSRVKNLLQTGAAGQSGKSNGSDQSSTATGATAPAGRPASATIEQAKFGRTEVDFRSHEVRIDGAPVRMTPKELRLLQYFLQHPGRVISRSELLTEVWQISGNLQTRAVDNFIARIRKIIESEPADPKHLVTIRDAGYRFIPEPEDS